MFVQNVRLPLKNVPVAHPQELDRESIRRELEKQEGICVLSLPGMESPGYGQVKALAEEIAVGMVRKPICLCLEQDMAKALGQALALRLGNSAEILCIDRVRLPEGSYLDVGLPIGPAFPVVVKTLILGG